MGLSAAAPGRRLTPFGPVIVGLALAALAGSFGASPADAQTGSGTVREIPVLVANGVVDNVLAGYLDEGIRRAAADGAPAVVIRLNTPGGALDATQRIVSSVLDAPVPTIVWVAPSGAWAASAGTFITMAGHIALMAPGTNIGAASVVSSEGNLEGDVRKKAFEHTQAMARSIAQTRGRNADWAIEAVRDAKSSTVTEAIELDVVDGLAASLDDVRAFADGHVVTVAGREVTLDLAGTMFRDVPMNPFQAFLHLLSDPNIAFILLTVGFYGLLFELQNPNFVTGIAGAIALLLAFIGLGSLPLNVAGLLLIGLAIVLFALELTVTSHGLLFVGGLVCFVLGASALYTDPELPTAPDVSVAWPVILAMAATTAAFMALALATVVRVRRRTVAFAGAYGAGGSTMVPTGTEGVAKTTLGPRGIVYAVGEEWSARVADATEIERGSPIRVVGQDGLTLIVEPAGR
jgi:membrane-bound serine protease (ClpP class)